MKKFTVQQNDESQQAKQAQNVRPRRLCHSVYASGSGSGNANGGVDRRSESLMASNLVSQSKALIDTNNKKAPNNFQFPSSSAASLAEVAEKCVGGEHSFIHAFASSVCAANDKTATLSTATAANKANKSASQSKSVDDGFVNSSPYKWSADCNAPLHFIHSAKFVCAYDVHLSEQFDAGWNCKKRGSAKKVALQFQVNGELISFVLKSITQKNFSNRLNIRPYQRASYVTIHLPKHSLSCVFFAVEQPTQPFHCQKSVLMQQIFHMPVKPNLVGVNPTEDERIPLLMLNSGKDTNGAHTFMAFFTHDATAELNVQVHAVQIDNHVVNIQMHELGAEAINGVCNTVATPITRTVPVKASVIASCTTSNVPISSSAVHTELIEASSSRKRLREDECILPLSNEIQRSAKTQRVEVDSPLSPMSPLSDVDSLPDLGSDSESEELLSLPDSPSFKASMDSSLPLQDFEFLNETPDLRVIGALRQNSDNEGEHEQKSTAHKEFLEQNPNTLAFHSAAFTESYDCTSFLPKASPVFRPLDVAPDAFLLPNTDSVMLAALPDCASMDDYEQIQSSGCHQENQSDEIVSGKRLSNAFNLAPQCAALTSLDSHVAPLFNSQQDNDAHFLLNAGFDFNSFCDDEATHLI